MHDSTQLMHIIQDRNVQSYSIACAAKHKRFNWVCEERLAADGTLICIVVHFPFVEGGHPWCHPYRIIEHCIYNCCVECFQILQASFSFAVNVRIWKDTNNLRLNSLPLHRWYLLAVILFFLSLPLIWSFFSLWMAMRAFLVQTVFISAILTIVEYDIGRK